MADIRKEEAVGTTDTAPMSKKIHSRIRVKVEVLKLNGHVRITSKDRAVDLVLPFSVLAPRMPRGESVVYFEAQIASTVGALEIGDRIELPEEKRW